MSTILDYIKSSLNDEQYQASIYTDSSSLILAGAGSGKTRTLTYKIAYLIFGLNIHPSKILAVTFTNKAANEMKERILSISKELNDKGLSNRSQVESPLDIDFDQVFSTESLESDDSSFSNTINLTNTSFRRVGTFHGIFLKILKEDIDKLGMGYNSNFTVYDESESISVIKTIINDLKYEDKIEAKDCKRAISSLKNRGIDANKFLHTLESKEEELIANVYQKYEKRMNESNSLDFDDLLYLTNKLFRTNDAVLNKWQEKFKYILVDEAQDTNEIQFDIIRNLSGKSGNVTFIGDDYQSIYGWRGAVMENFLNISKYRNDVKIFKLELNYRSRPFIVNAGNAIIKNNKKQYDKNVKSVRSGEDHIRIMGYKDGIDEAINTIEFIKRLKNEKNFTWKDFAILYRTNAQSQPFEQILLTEGIPYKVWGGFKFFERKEIKDVISYLKYISNPKDNVSLMRIINVPNRKIGATTLDKISEYGNENDISFNTLIENIDTLPIKLTPSALTNIKQFNTIIKFLNSQLNNMNPGQIIESLISNIKYKDFLIASEGKDKGEEKFENVGQLINMAVKYDNTGIESLRQFLEEVSLMTDIEDAQDGESTDVIKLMSVHGSKGLEFPIVFIVGLEDGVFPLPKAKFDEREMEEERRLLYVAITRAKDILFLSYANCRQQWGQTKYNPPSKFLDEIPKEICNTYDISGNGSNRGGAYGKTAQSFNEGDIVTHKLFGRGKLIEIWDDTGVIRFDNPKYGLKKIDLRFLSK